MNRLLPAMVIVTLFASCTETPTNTSDAKMDTVAADSNEMRIQVPDQTCYRFTSASDTVFLKVEKFPNVVTGQLSYILKEKDKNTGDLDGVMKGDTLVAQYSFMSEGTRSTREVKIIVQPQEASDLSTGYKLLKVPCETN